MSDIFSTPHEIALEIAINLRERRLSSNMSQQTLSEKSGVSLSVLKKFEREGKISLESLLKLAAVLDSLGRFSELFKEPLSSFVTLDALIKKQDKKRKRGRL